MSATDSPSTSENQHESQLRALRRSTKAYEGALLRHSIWQIANSFPPFIAVCALMYYSLALSYAVTLALGVVAAGMFVRIFIIQHDCGHGSFFRSRRANDILGMLCSLITLTPYTMWRRQHAGHHSHWNNLDRRFSGMDVYSGCLTIEEFRDMSPIRRFWYQKLRHPLMLWVILPPAIFIILYRFPFDTPRGWRHERRAVQLTNLALLGLFLCLGFTLGFRAVLLVQVPVVTMAAMIGVWLFSVQHRFEQALWARQPAWHPVSAALEGSSYLKLPRVLQWFTGNIGFHHVHHLNPRIPNYRLQACHESSPALRKVFVMTPWHGLGTWRAALWDDRAHRMVPFSVTAELDAVE